MGRNLRRKNLAFHSSRSSRASFKIGIIMFLHRSFLSPYIPRVYMLSKRSKIMTRRITILWERKISRQEYEALREREKDRERERESCKNDSKEEYKKKVGTIKKKKR